MLFDMRSQEADDAVAAVRAERDPRKASTLARLYLSDPALPQEQRQQLKKIWSTLQTQSLHTRSSAPPPA
jgi:hypothetical protein